MTERGDMDKIDFEKEAREVISRFDGKLGKFGIGALMTSKQIDMLVKEIADDSSKAYRSGAEEMKEKCASVVDRWHYKKGGYCELAHTLRELEVK